MPPENDSGAVEAAAAAALAAQGGADPAGAAQLRQGEAEAARTDETPVAGVLHVESVAAAAALLAAPEVAAFDPGAGAAHIAERTEGFTLRPIGTVAEERLREIERPRVPGVTRDVLPRTDHLVDPDTVPGHRYATVASQLRHNHLTYQPGQTVRIDFRAYSQLVPVGAILPTPWRDLPEHDPDD